MTNYKFCLSSRLRVATLRRYDNKNEYVLSKQLLRSGTSVGANVKEAIRGQSKADFIAKMNNLILNSDSFLNESKLS